METLTQLIYSKIAGAPKEWFSSKEGRRIIAKSLRLIRQKEGKIEAKYFRNLVSVSTFID